MGQPARTLCRDTARSPFAAVLALGKRRPIVVWRDFQTYPLSNSIVAPQGIRRGKHGLQFGDKIAIGVRGRGGSRTAPTPASQILRISPLTSTLSRFVNRCPPYFSPAGVILF